MFAVHPAIVALQMSERIDKLSNVRNVGEAWDTSSEHVDPRTLVTPTGRLCRKSQAWTRRNGSPVCLLPAVVHNSQLIPAISIVRARCSRRSGAIRRQRTGSRTREHQVDKSSVDRCMHDTCSVVSSSRDRFPTARAPAARLCKKSACQKVGLCEIAAREVKTFAI